MRRRIAEAPVIGPAAIYAYRVITAPGDRDAIQALAAQGDLGQRFAEVIERHLGNQLVDCPAVTSKIEAAREELRGQRQLLIDGSLGDGAVFDNGVKISTLAEISKSSSALRFMCLLVKEFKPNNALELGTNIGISSAYLGAALHENENQGRLTTLEASPYRLRIAKNLHQSLAINNVSYVQGLFTDTLPGVLAEMEPVDFAFVDGHHQYQPTLDYFDMIRRHATNDAIFIFDDIRWSDGMKRAWREISESGKIRLAIDLNSIGVAVNASIQEAKPYVSSKLRGALLY